MSAVSMFYLAHWAAFVTGKMLFGLIDVTEAQLCIMSLFLVHTLLGPTFWEIEVRPDCLENASGGWGNFAQSL